MNGNGTLLERKATVEEKNNAEERIAGEHVGTLDGKTRASGGRERERERDTEENERTANLYAEDKEIEVR